MKIVLKSVGALKGEMEIEPGKLTVFSGGNNTGKTYAMYILWALFHRRIQHVFSFAERFADQLRIQGSVHLPLDEFCAQNWLTIENGIASGLRKRLPDLFSAPPKFFASAEVRINLDLSDFRKFAVAHPSLFKRSIGGVGASSTLDVRLTNDDGNLAIALTALDAGKLPNSLLTEIISSLFIDLVLSTQIDGAFLLPAERGGLNLFYPDLDAKNAALVRHLKRDESNPLELIKDLMVAQYAEPIDAYIQFLKRVPRNQRIASGFHDQALELQKKIVRVRYKVSKDGVVTAKPYRSDAELGIHLTSSSVKSFYGLWAWLELQAKPGDCLMIDEPELNLHPDNQRLIARLLARLVNLGIKVIISTHSDYIIRELNNMIMLGTTDFPNRTALEKRFGYDDSGQERLDATDIAAYQFKESGVHRCEISSEFGIEVSSMDAAINQLNEANSAIYFAVADALHPVIDSEVVQLGAG